ncbi:MAG: hypothetical protein DMG05_30575 [Acidobacteria bacterium]|nr:MAG: hypothetical protein DMG05_30575 [Acidobacteriota bacterium]
MASDTPEKPPVLALSERDHRLPGNDRVSDETKKEAKKIEDRSRRLFAPSLYATAAFYFFIPTPISRKRSTASLGLKSSLPALATWRAGRNVSAT